MKLKGELETKKVVAKVKEIGSIADEVKNELEKETLVKDQLDGTVRKLEESAEEMQKRLKAEAAEKKEVQDSKKKLEGE